MSLELQHKDFIFVTVDHSQLNLDLADVSSKTVMESNGWVFHGKKGCGTGKWYEDSNGQKVCGPGSWYCSGSAIGSISTTLRGSGSATLDFGNCYTKGKVVVLLNGQEINGKGKSTANANVKSKNITFKFIPGDELKIIEPDNGIIKLNSFTLSKRSTPRIISLNKFY